MESFNQWLSETGDFLYRMIAERNITFMLTVGIIVLTIALFVLMRTRWGQAKPVSKCIALSILAHVLLIGYAWSTKLIFNVPAPQTVNSPTQVTLIHDAAEEDSKSDDSVGELKPWQKFDNSETPENLLDDIQRAETNNDVEIEKTALPKPELKVIQPKSVEPESQIGKLEIQPQKVPVVNASHKIETPEKPKAEQIEFQRRQMQVKKPEILKPNTEEPSRIQVARNVDIKPAGTNLKSHDIDINQRIENITRTTPDLNDGPGKTNGVIQNRIQQSKTQSDDLSQTPSSFIKTPKRFDGQLLPKVYQNRTADNRQNAVKKNGGSKKTEAAVNNALAWLAKNQERDGRWNPRSTGGGTEKLVFGHNRQGAGTNADTGITGLALLAFLGAGHTQHSGPYADNVSRALKFLISKQKQDGSLAGDSRLFARMYCHSMALFALSEAYAVTGDKSLKDAVSRGVQYSIRAQNPTDGSWRYQPGDAGDMSQLGWQVMALKAAKLGGIKIPDSVFNKMKGFIKRCARGKNGGLAAYRPSERASVTMTAESLLCRHFLESKIDPKISDEACTYLERSLPSLKAPNYYYWYYSTLAMFQTGGKHWEKWNTSLTKTLLSSQSKSGANSGSWPPNGLWAGYGGRVYSTAMATLSLEVYYRYLTSLK